MERFRKRIRGQHGPGSDHGRRGRFQGGFRLRAQVFALGDPKTTSRSSGSCAPEGGSGPEDGRHLQQQRGRQQQRQQQQQQQQQQHQQRHVERGQRGEQTEDIPVACSDDVPRAHSGDVVRWLPHRVAVIVRKERAKGRRM